MEVFFFFFFFFLKQVVDELAKIAPMSSKIPLKRFVFSFLLNGAIKMMGLTSA